MSPGELINFVAPLPLKSPVILVIF